MQEKICDGVTKNDNKIAYITFLSVVASFAVLVLHTNGCFWSFSATEQYWKTANIIESVFYFAVPVFLMITGITLMDFFDRYSLKGYFFKRFSKTVLPFFAWSVIGVIGRRVFSKSVDISELSLVNLYQSIIGTSVINIYWFFIVLFNIYLCIPLFAAVEKKKRKVIFSYLAVVGFVCNILIPFIKSVMNIELNTPLGLQVVANVLFWPIVGWLLHNYEFSKIQKGCIYILSVAGLAMHMLGTYYLSIESGYIVDTYKGYSNVPCVLYSVGIFILLKDIGKWIMSKKASVVIEIVGRYTLEIYLIQFVFLEFFSRLSFIDMKSILYRLGAPIIIIPCIIVITYILRKIPIVRHIVP